MNERLDVEWIVGRLYGNLLARNADPDGFLHYCAGLRSGRPLVEMVEEIMKSDEFVEKFIVNDTPNEIARKMVSCLLGDEFASAETVKNCAVIIARHGFPGLLERLVRDPKYLDMHGSFGVPKYIS